MKRLFTLLFVPLAFFSLAGSALALDIKIEDTKLPTSGGQVPIIVSSTKDLGAVDFKVSYDAKVLKFKSAELGKVSKNGMIDFKDGDGVVLISLVDTEGISKDGEIVKLNFDVLAKNESNSKLTLQAKAFGTDLKDIQVQTKDGLVTIEQGNTLIIALAIVAAVVILFIIFGVVKKKRQ